MLLMLHEEDKFRDVETLNRLIWAELPDPANRLLYERVTKFMVHGP